MPPRWLSVSKPQDTAKMLKLILIDGMPHAGIQAHRYLCADAPRP